MTVYDPVADYMRQRPNSKRPRGEELRLLKTLSKLEVDALVSIDNKAGTSTAWARRCISAPAPTECTCSTCWLCGPIRPPASI